MATTTSSASQAIHFDVEYYNKYHRDLLLGFQEADFIKTLVEEGIDIDVEIFLGLSTFREQSNNHVGFRTFQELWDNLGPRREYLLKFFSIEDVRIQSQWSANEMPTDVTESVGVGGSILAANRVFGLHEADWEKIPEGGTKTLDFRFASDGDRFIDVESKGNIGAGRNNSVSNHRSHILKKKNEQRDHGNENVMLGAITQIPYAGSDNPTVYLMDPPAEDIDFDPAKYQLLARLFFYWRELQVLSPRSSIAIALGNRIRAIMAAKHYLSLDGIPLVNGRGKPLSYQLPKKLRANAQSALESEEIGAGVIVPAEKRIPYFYGLHQSVFDLIINQEFLNITSYFAVEDAGERTKSLVVTELNGKEANAMNLDTSSSTVSIKTNTRDRFEFEGDLTVTPAGRVIGLLSQTPY